MSPAAPRGRAWRAGAAILLVVLDGTRPGAARAQAAPAAAPDALDPGSPLAPLPGLGIDWPDLATAPATAPASPTSAATEAGEQRYAVRIEGVDAVRDATLRTRFDALSALAAGASKPANVAQVDRRARQDGSLLRDLLRADGYYDAEVDARVARPAGPGTGQNATRLTVALVAAPGELYRYDAVATPGLDATGADRDAMMRAIGIAAGDPVDAQRANAAAAALQAELGRRGYAFATVAEPKVTVDHDARRATLTLAVDPGRTMRLGAIRLTGRRVFGPAHVQLISRLKPGDRFDARRLDDLRRALIQTGLVSVVQITPVRTADAEVVDLQVHLEPAPPRTVAAAIGYGTGEGATVELSWQHRNLLPPEGAVTFRGLLGTQEQLVSAGLRRGNFRARDQVLTAQVALDHQNRPAYDAKTATLAAGIERQTNIIWQKKWTYSYGAELIASDERDVIAATGEPRRRTYTIAAAPLSLAYDGTDDLLNPTRKWRLSAHVSPELSFHDGSFGYARIQLDGSAYQPIGARVVLAGRARLGTIQGAGADRIAPTRRFYSGGGGSVRGYGYQRIGPRDVDNDPIGGRSLAEFGLEARFRFGDFGIVPFLDGGNLYREALPRFTGFRYGTGIGARYYTSFGPVRVDVGTPINRQSGDSRVAVYVSLGQAF
ncbi:autotransporter assembly complex protein TamA [Sphingomonas sp.]|uniref:autotransporter assembly complex protein TamA n=1 Tax=Sphingomonas sp. TaxID=28214 RepID=UPI003AFF6C1F